MWKVNCIHYAWKRSTTDFQAQALSSTNPQIVLVTVSIICCLTYGNLFCSERNAIYWFQSDLDCIILLSAYIKIQSDGPVVSWNPQIKIVMPCVSVINVEQKPNSDAPNNGWHKWNSSRIFSGFEYQLFGWDRTGNFRLNTMALLYDTQIALLRRKDDSFNVVVARKHTRSVSTEHNLFWLYRQIRNGIWIESTAYAKANCLDFALCLNRYKIGHKINANHKI